MTSDMLSQEEIDALLSGSSADKVTHDFFEDDNEELLSDIEIDALGEIGNISMGTAATTLSTLLNRKVNITTPRVKLTTVDELADDYKLPLVAIDVSYKEGLEGSNILILNTDDAKIITDLMMGKDSFDTDRELTELDLSAVSEAMNQMMGSSSTSLSEMLMRKIDIEPPKSLEITFAEGKNKIDLLNSSSPIIKISFKMVIGDLIDSNIMQLVPLEFGKSMVEKLMGSPDTQEETPVNSRVSVEPNNVIEQYIETPVNKIKEEVYNIPQTPANDIARTENMNYNDISNIKEDKIVVKKPEFQSFDTSFTSSHSGSIDLVGDIPVEITVELGRTHKKISEILEFGQGTVVELDKLVGEALNIYANGRYIAKGEVVVIDDNFGVRVTEIESSSRKII
ncbi:flagellar motor switch protein FliN/FliY [Tissierella praeacuta DSM 18095]|uniref:Flagellar motor switch protein FliN/FliY n=1 Tax=Tissierella praeacuta DSM 18095 TaxID=1123404 RepID=A0A1M4SL50_9FIRM|nr:flagellar motor switch phosphatase FliY [Tissierella praeacuta]TCU70579.1 flagellar motor switch protein FliN/FliY [Tissierella praeacuta]SHE32909.1 flagellar motor switch protein FliN/FliY [Tissierella praeacuta DSM 18095]SUP01533.1 Flagellar motor switch protein FliN [Tissierella praeacuta]